MGVSKIDLANMALGLLLRDTIRNLDGSEPGAVQMKQNIDLAINSVIAAYDWYACRVIKPLELVDNPDLPLRGWTYAYQVPSDAVMIWRISDLKGNVQNNFEMGMTDNITEDDNYIYADDAGLAVRYGSSRVNLARFQPQIIDLMATNLAIRTCMPLTKDVKMYQNHKNNYKAELSAAKTLFANIEPEVTDIEFVPEAISVRSE